MLGVLWTPEARHPPFAPSVPAALYPVGGRPAAGRAADALAEAGAVSVLVVSGDERVREWAASDRSPVDCVAADASAVREHARGHDRVLVASATAVVAPDALRRVAAASPAVTATDGGASSPPAAYAATPAAFETVREPSALADVPRSVPESARVSCERALDVRRPWELLGANERALDDIERDISGDVDPDADVRGRVVVEPGASVASGVVVDGPAYLSEGCELGPNAYVRGRTFVGRNAHVGHAVEVKNSVLFAGAALPHLTYVGDSVVGPRANVGAGSLVANLRHDDADVRVAHEGSRVSTDRRKFGAVVGEDATLGIGTHVNVGVTLGAGASTHPGEVLTRDRGCEPG